MKKYFIFPEEFKLTYFQFHIPISLKETDIDKFESILKFINNNKHIIKAESIYDKKIGEILVFDIHHYNCGYKTLFDILFSHDEYTTIMYFSEYEDFVCNDNDNMFYYIIDFSNMLDYFDTTRSLLYKGYASILKFSILNKMKVQLEKGNAKIILCSGNECITNSSLYDWNTFYKIVKLEPENFVLLTGDARLGTQTSIPTVYDYFWEINSSFWMRNFGKNNHNSVVTKIKNIQTKKQAKWYGLCLNRITKPHRTIMAKFFDEHLKDKINYSYGLTECYGSLGEHNDTWSDTNYITRNKLALGWSEKINRMYTYDTVEHNIKIDEIKEWIMSHGEKYSEGDICDMTVNMNYILHNESYINSYFNIVTESYVENKDELTTFLSEKTYKPIMWYQPFIIVGQPYSIDILRKDGYDVFDNIIDHSYDMVLPLVKRIKLIQQEITRLCSISKEDWSEILNDNFSGLHNNFWHLKGSADRMQHKLQYGLDNPVYKTKPKNV